MNYSIRDCLLLALIAGLSVSLLLFLAYDAVNDFNIPLSELIKHFVWINFSYLLVSIFAWYFRSNLESQISIWKFISILGSFTYTITFWLVDYSIKSNGYEKAHPKIQHLLPTPPSLSEYVLSGFGLAIFTSIITKFIFRQKETIAPNDLSLFHKN